MKRTIAILAGILLFTLLLAQLPEEYPAEEYPPEYPAYPKTDYEMLRYLSITGFAFTLLGGFIMFVVALPAKSDKIFVEVIPQHLELLNRKKLQFGTLMIIIGLILLGIAVSRLLDGY